MGLCWGQCSNQQQLGYTASCQWGSCQCKPGFCAKDGALDAMGEWGKYTKPKAGCVKRLRILWYTWRIFIDMEYLYIYMMYVMYCNLCMYACVDIICLLICFMFACVTLHTCISIYIYIVFTAVQRTLSPIPQNQRFNINKAVLKGNLGLYSSLCPDFQTVLGGVASWVVLLNSQNIMSNFMQNRPLWHIHWYLRYSNIYIYIYCTKFF